MLPISAGDIRRMCLDFPGASALTKVPNLGVLFLTLSRDLYLLPDDGSAKRCVFVDDHAPVVPAGTPQQPPKAARLELPYQHAVYQVLPGGTLLTCCRVVPAPRGVVGANVQPIPVSSVFLPGVYLVDAVDSTGGRGLFAVQLGTSLEDVGLVASVPSGDEVSE